MPSNLDIDSIATKLNELSDSHPIGKLPLIRKRQKGLSRLPRQIFTANTIKERYAFHNGGRKELQFNIGYEGDKFRHGVAFSFEPGQTLPDIGVLIPKARLFNEYLKMYPEQFADMRMWHYIRGERSGNYAPGAILPELIKPHVFVFLGKRQPVSNIDYETILSDFDRLLPLYEFVETGSERLAIPGSTGFKFRPGTTVRTMSTVATLAERQLNITLRHNLMQAALYQRLIAEHGDGNVSTEQPSGLGTLIDVTLCIAHQKYWYYEIKTALSPRACLREALGQILEYSFWPGAQEAARLIVCGESKLDAEGAAYLRQLQTRFRLPIYYEQIKLPSKAS